VALAVLLADAALVAVDKPPGRVVIPGRGAPERTLLDEAQAEHGRLWVVHRLDRGTSGVLLFARSAAAHRALNLAFEGRAVEKRYLAIVRGAPPDEARLDLTIAHARKGRMRPGRPGEEGAKPAATRVRVLERFPARPPLPALALVEAVPETGRTHQIRVHLAWAGTPLACDPDYGEAEPLRDAAGTALLARTPLHAAALAFPHPASGARVQVEAPLPADMAALLAAARAP
jgi:tRNA pseudouridine32 synthase/23S rRNA pseudouridine746 synthase